MLFGGGTNLATAATVPGIMVFLVGIFSDELSESGTARELFYLFDDFVATPSGDENDPYIIIESAGCENSDAYYAIPRRMCMSTSSPDKVWKRRRLTWHTRKIRLHALSREGPRA